MEKRYHVEMPAKQYNSRYATLFPKKIHKTHKQQGKYYRDKDEIQNNFLVPAIKSRQFFVSRIRPHIHTHTQHDRHQVCLSRRTPPFYTQQLLAAVTKSCKKERNKRKEEKRAVTKMKADDNNMLRKLTSPKWTCSLALPARAMQMMSVICSRVRRKTWKNTKKKRKKGQPTVRAVAPESKIHHKTDAKQATRLSVAQKETAHLFLSAAKRLLSVLHEYPVECHRDVDTTNASSIFSRLENHRLFSSDTYIQTVLRRNLHEMDL